MSVVVDTSLVVALEVGDDRQAAVQDRLTRWLNNDEALPTPAVLPYEVANVLVRLTFDGVLAAEDIAHIWSDLSALDLVMHPFDLGKDGPAVAALGQVARDLLDARGLTRVLVVCHADNGASAATIEGNGGRLDTETSDERVSRYWIKG